MDRDRGATVEVPRQEALTDREAALKFFRQWLREPRSIAALAPSGRELARRVAAAAGRQASAVVELGGGTGVITEALLERGIPPARLLVLERNPELHAHLSARFPGVEVALADAFDLAAVVARSRAVAAGEIDAVASGLGMLTMAREDQRRLLAAAFGVLRPGGRFVQFTYAPASPVAKELLDAFGLEARRASWSLLNLPPAFVYVFRRPRRG